MDMKQLFLTSNGTEAIDSIVAKLPKKPSEYKLAFITTASEVELGDLHWLREEKDKLSSVGFNIIEFSITNMSPFEINKKFLDIDIIYLAGGNTFYLLDQVIKTGADVIIRRFIDNGGVYIGSSAGSMIAGIRIDLVGSIDDITKAPDLKSNGLGIIDSVILPHWGSNHFKDRYYKTFFDIYVTGVKIIPISDGQYLWVQDDNIKLVQS